jgi:hypothetical protein
MQDNSTETDDSLPLFESSQTTFKSNEDAELELIIKEMIKISAEEDEFLLRQLYESFVLGRFSNDFNDKLKRMQQKYKI